MAPKTRKPTRHTRGLIAPAPKFDKTAPSNSSFISDIAGGVSDVLKVGKSVTSAVAKLVGGDFVSTISSLFSVSSEKGVITRRPFTMLRGHSNSTYAQAGDVMLNIPINPKTMGLPRLRNQSVLYEKFQFPKLVLKYHPTASAMTSGQLVGYVIYDAKDVPPEGGGEKNLQRAFSAFGAKAVQVRDVTSWELKLKDPSASFYVDTQVSGDTRLSEQARFILLAASDFSESIALGSISVDYAINFYYPRVEDGVYYATCWTAAGNGSMTTTNFLGTPTVPTYSNLTVEYKDNTFTLQSGRYLLTCYFHGTGFGTWDWVVPGESFTTDVNIKDSSTNAYGMCTLDVMLTDGAAYDVSLAWTGTSTSFTSTTCTVVPLPLYDPYTIPRTLVKNEQKLTVSGRHKTIHSWDEEKQDPTVSSTLSSSIKPLLCKKIPEDTDDWVPEERPVIPKPKSK